MEYRGLILIITIVCGVCVCTGQTTTFTYQGKLTDGSFPASVGRTAECLACSFASEVLRNYFLPDKVMVYGPATCGTKLGYQI